MYIEISIIFIIRSWLRLFGAPCFWGDFMDQKQGKASQPNSAKVERPIPSEIYPVIDNDLARDNVENDLPAADLQDLQ